MWSRLDPDPDDPIGHVLWALAAGLAAAGIGLFVLGLIVGAVLWS